MDDQIRGLDVEKAEAALKRAAAKALRGTREERAGKFVLDDEVRPMMPKKAEVTRAGRKKDQT